MRSLAEFAAFVKKEKLEEFAIEELKLLKTKDIPLMKFFKDLTAEQLHQMTKVGLEAFLTHFENGTAYAEAAESLRKWEADELPGISKSDIHPSDLVLVYYVQKVSFQKFLPHFTSDPQEIIHVITELEEYYTEVQENAIQFLFKLQKEAEAEIIAREAQLNEAQELALIGSYDWEVGAETTTSSPEIFRIFGLSRDAKNISMKEFTDAIHEEDFPEVQKAINTSVETLAPFNYEYRLVMPDKTIKHVHARGKIVPGENGKASRLVGTVQDITARKRNEAKILKKTEELERSNSDLQRFASVASHDLKEPLRKIQIFADMLMDDHKDVLGEDGQLLLNKIITSGDRMESVIQALLSFSTLGAEKEPASRIDLKSLLKDISDDYELLIQQKNAKLNIENLPVIEGAASQISQLFQNLIGNALKFNRPGVAPVVDISAQIVNGGKSHEITIKDNGIGFDEKYSSQIFEVFQRLHRKEEYEGTGIGLSICKKIVENHQGTITVRSQINEGATFIITLPVKIK